MKCGVRFCGGCNPRFDRGKALKEIEREARDIEFVHAQEDDVYDLLLVMGGCSSCCASYEHFKVKGDVYKVWDYSQIETIKNELISKQED